MHCSRLNCLVAGDLPLTPTWGTHRSDTSYALRVCRLAPGHVVLHGQKRKGRRRKGVYPHFEVPSAMCEQNTKSKHWHAGIKSTTKHNRRGLAWVLGYYTLYKQQACHDAVILSMLLQRHKLG